MNNTKSPFRSSLAAFFVLTLGLSACAACGPNLAGDEGAGGSGMDKPVSPAQHDGGMLPCDDTGCDAYPEGPGGTGEDSSVSVSAVLHNPKARAYVIRVKMSAGIGWPETSVGYWDSGLVTLQPGQTITHPSVYSVPADARQSADVTVWEADPALCSATECPGDYSGRGISITATGPSVTCTGSVWLDWPNAANAECVNH